MKFRVYISYHEDDKLMIVEEVMAITAANHGIAFKAAMMHIDDMAVNGYRLKNINIYESR